MNTIQIDADGKAMLSDMIEATRKIFNENWNDVGPFVEMESQHVLDSLSTIARLKQEGSISEEQARLQLVIQRDCFLSLLLTVKGIRRIQAENAVNAALAVIRSSANRLLGWSLL